ncbi:hypothetical protein QZH41_006134 [Actinostola sp. cb2023]|nr:hypothetical protein QZH41_006134 [Actinostola sp. cb2023]
MAAITRAAWFSAVSHGNERELRQLIDAAADINVTNNDGYTALMLAAQYGMKEVARALMEAGADINVTNNDGYTALMLAAVYGKEEVTRALIDVGADINVTNNGGYTALMVAAVYGKEEVARALIDVGADINVTNNDGYTALMLAAVYGKEEVARALIDVGADINVTNNGGYTALMVAAVYGKEEVARALIDVGADINVTNNDGYTALMLAAVYGKEEVARALIDVGADINVTNNDGYTALMLAAVYGKEEVARALIDVGADINVTNNDGYTALMLAAVYGKEEVARALIDAGADLSTTDLEGQTAIFAAAKYGHEAVTRVLIDDEILLLKDAETRAIGLQEAVKLLKMFSPPKVTKGVTVNKTDNNLNSPLHLWALLSLAAAEEYTGNVSKDSTFENILQTILEHLSSCGVKLNARNTNEETPLHLCKTWSAVKLLVEAGANTTDLDSSRRPPLLFAAKNHVFAINPQHFYPDVQDDPIPFFETCLKMGLDPWACGEDGESVLSILLESKVFALANALIEVACQENHAKLESLLETICKDKSTRTYWKSTVVEKMLKSRNVQATAALRYCCMNIKELHDRESAKSDSPDSEAKSDSRRESKSIDGEEIKKPRNDHSKDHSASSSVHWEIAKQLRLHGADCKSCEDIARNYPELNELLTNEIDINHVPMIIPWTSYSTTHKAKLAEVARRRNYDTVGTYWFHQDPIGSGSFGHVFAGINEKDGREVAIKKIEKLRMVQPQDKREIRNLTALADCQQVVRYIFFDDNDRSFAFVVLELMEGHLDDYFESASFDARESTPLCKDVAMGLKYLHEHKPKPILHRDLKPGNILYKTHPKLCLKIADFGLSSPIDGASKTTVLGTNVGTRCWVASEVIRSAIHQHTMSSDVFACGLILHYILSSQKHPFNPADCKDKDGKEKSANIIDLEIQHNIVNNNMEGWNNCLSPEATHLVKQMLDSHETQRPSAADALNHPMFWSNKKKMDFLSAVGNQQLNAVETDLQATFPTIVKHTTWNDAMYTHMPDIHYEMTQLIVKTGKTGKLYTVSPKKYKTGSVVELIRFIRNAIAHASDASRPSLFSKQILEDCVFF